MLMYYENNVANRVLAIFTGFDKTVVSKNIEFEVNKVLGGSEKTKVKNKRYGGM